MCVKIRSGTYSLVIQHVKGYQDEQAKDSAGVSRSWHLKRRDLERGKGALWKIRCVLSRADAPFCYDEWISRKLNVPVNWNIAPVEIAGENTLAEFLFRVRPS